MISEITLKKLSQLSGLSVSTISKALNDRYDVSEKTKLKVHELAESFGYVPNNFAKTLRTKKTYTLAIIVPQIDCDFCSNLLSVIQKEAFNKGYHILILQSLICKNTVLECMDKIRCRVDGIIIVNMFNQKDNIINNIFELSKLNFPPILTQKIEKMPLNEIKSIGKKILTSLIRIINKE